MKILHTSDWHIGKSLFGKQRYNEFELFTSWIIDLINEREIDILIIAGDIFDTTTPSNKAQSLYYNFINSLGSSCCKKTIIISGNHDSPTFLKASKSILKTLNIEVVTEVYDNIEENIFKIDKDEESLIVCSIPYLREKDIRKYEENEEVEDKVSSYNDGIKSCYENIVSKALSIYQNRENSIPVIATGHLFTAGASKVEGDGVRDLYIGSLSYFDSTLFPKEIDYLALGHIHQPQIVGRNSSMRFSGSPLPMNFGEKFNRNIVIEVEFNNGSKNIVEHRVPRFQELVKIVGSYEEISQKIDSLILLDSSVWLEIDYNGKEVKSDLKQLLLEGIKGSKLEILKITNRMAIKPISGIEVSENLENLNHLDLFKSLLDNGDIEEDQREDLIDSFKRIVSEVLEEDESEDS
ncbi:MAG: exonuclease sbcCD subunit D [Candidatus Cloacimonadota bacterium]|nr:MAG: exonuclease sbcCD subunit D [Candidatus Cloacimonadota bacterium]PIE78600.1 MAG: exonuclease sbcCD subunit D [Candidatus Delongbacteria bacterium]